ncbi:MULTISPECIES: amidohydrolase family protein [Maribacter]|uniref:Amidohydrolase family protein n=1 Tax=Maribacter flavus TaxID=1658664 RepID=A0ABU7IMK7_9FLAO|nr:MULTISPECIES: amidohydrolase family protein [Maribacter]MDC6406149.1 amidohydrolase family protein [Maribacter sp. PR66]MEE1974192.1 amidohydrolase family protein [Maribacter flavus]
MRYLIYLVLVCCFVACTSNQQHRFDLVISNVNLIDGTGKPIQSNVSIGIKDGRVTAIDSVSIEGAKNSIDGTGKFLIPGLFDCHVHTSEFEKDFPRFMHYGVTSIFITGGSSCTNEYYASMRSYGNQDTLPAPIVFHTSQHFTMEGRHPLKTYQGNWEDGKTVFLLNDTLQIENLVKEVTQYPIIGIKLTIEDGPHPPWVERMPQAFINKVQKEAMNYDTEVFAHVSDNVELEMAMDAGIQNIVHWTGIDIDFQRDTVLLEKIYQVRPSFITTFMIDKGFLYPLFPEWVADLRQENVFDEAYFENANKPEFLARAEQNMGFWRDYFQKDSVKLADIAAFQVEDIIALSENGIRFALGTDTGFFVMPGYSLHEEMQLLEMGGMEPLDIIKMGTYNAAEMMHAQDSLGSIEMGKIANMVLLDKNPLDEIRNTMAINTVIKRGKVQKRIEK